MQEILKLQRPSSSSFERTKIYVEFFLNPVLDLLDSVLGKLLSRKNDSKINFSDIIYFYKITGTLSLFWLRASVITIMEIFVTLSFVKDTCLALDWFLPFTNNFV